jgi:Flp pilus assembly protein TadG
MRRLTRHDRDDLGVVTLFVIGAIPILLLAAAGAIDVGRYVVENRSAQNSADATALAVATDCARTGSPLADYATYRKTGQSINTPACDSGTVTITVTKTVTEGLLLNRDGRTTHRSATAQWGTLGTATTVPITISNCEFSQLLLDGTTDIVLYLDDPKPQSGCSSLPGGFSQLVDDDCAVTVSAGGTVAGDPGGDIRKQVPCITNATAPALPKDVLIPMYDAAACQAADCKGRGPYSILGFAVFHVTGYSFNGNANDGTLGKDCPDQGNRGKYCIRGDFIRFVTSQGSPGPSTNFGTYQVYLSS